jgi:hypothetical protein
MSSPLIFQNEYGVDCDDLLNSEKYINEFHSIIINSTYSVYALSGDWGSGKTCFIKMWQNFLKKENKIYVYIDAFKFDYETDPFIMLIKAFRDSFKQINTIDNSKLEEWKGKAKNILSWRNLGKLGLNILIEKTVGLDAVKDFMNDTLNSSFDHLTDENSLYDDLHASLNNLLDENNTLHIIIDELDRCRPDFALETFEKLKHIFNVKNVKYILVYNEKIMKSIIIKKYGNEINASRYLQKYVQRAYFLDFTKRRLKEWFIKEVQNPLEKYNSSGMPYILMNSNVPLLEIGENYELRLRDFQHLFSSLKHYKIENEKLMVSLICFELLKIINNDEFNNLVNYYFEYNKFASNMPSRNIYYKLLKHFDEYKNSENDILDDCFYSVMKYISERPL